MRVYMENGKSFYRSATLSPSTMGDIAVLNGLKAMTLMF